MRASSGVGASCCAGVLCVALVVEGVGAMYPRLSDCLRHEWVGICREPLPEFTLPDDAHTEVGTPTLNRAPLLTGVVTATGTNNIFQLGG